MRTRAREKGQRYDERAVPEYWWREAEAESGWKSPYFVWAYMEAKRENNRWEHRRNQAIHEAAWEEARKATAEKAAARLEAKREKEARMAARASRLLAEREAREVAKAEKKRLGTVEAERAAVRRILKKPGVIVTVMDEEEVGRLGPKMLALPNDRWRAFVVAFLGMAEPNAKRAYRAAFPDAGENTAGVRGQQLLKDLRIKEAIHEEALSRLESGMLVKALNLAEMILDDPANPKAAAVAFGIMDRAGLHPKSEHRVTVEKTVDFGDAAQVLRLKEKLERLGFDPLPVLGNRLAALVDGRKGREEVTDAEYSELPGEAAE